MVISIITSNFMSLHFKYENGGKNELWGAICLEKYTDNERRFSVGMTNMAILIVFFFFQNVINFLTRDNFQLRCGVKKESLFSTFNRNFTVTVFIISRFLPHL